MNYYLTLDSDGYACGFTETEGVIPVSSGVVKAASREEAQSRINHRKQGNTWVQRPAPSRFQFSRAEFLSRFTDDELGALRSLGETNPAAAGFCDWLMSQDTLDLKQGQPTHARVLAGLGRLVGSGAMTASRRTELLASA